MAIDPKHDIRKSVADMVRELAALQQAGELGAVALVAVTREGSIARRWTVDDGFGLLLLAAADLLHNDIRNVALANSVSANADTDTDTYPIMGAPNVQRPN